MLGVLISFQIFDYSRPEVATGVPKFRIIKIVFMMFSERVEWEVLAAFYLIKNIDSSQSYGWLKVSAYA
jgi:hypothetical protein